MVVASLQATLRACDLDIDLKRVLAFDQAALLEPIGNLTETAANRDCQKHALVTAAIDRLNHYYQPNGKT